jgi:hypothetical protein
MVSSKTKISVFLDFEDGFSKMKNKFENVMIYQCADVQNKCMCTKSIVLAGLDRPSFPPPWPPVATALGLSCHRTGHGLFVQWDNPIKMIDRWHQWPSGNLWQNTNRQALAKRTGQVLSLQNK